MTMPSRGVAKIQTKATGDAMKCGMKKGGEAMPMGKKDPRKTAPSNSKKKSSKMSLKGNPMDKASLGRAESASGIPGMMGKGYAKGGMIDGCAKKGKTKGKIC
jgi:hypothetical protein